MARFFTERTRPSIEDLREDPPNRRGYGIDANQDLAHAYLLVMGVLVAMRWPAAPSVFMGSWPGFQLAAR
jgi:hypothetical protein